MSHRSPCRSSCRPSGAGKRILWVLVVGAVAAGAVSLFHDARSRRSVAPAPAPEPMSKMTARRLQSHASDNAVIGGAAVAQQELAVRQRDKPGVTVQVNADIDAGQFEAAKPAVPAPRETGKGSPAIKLTRVRSEAPHANRDKAITDALLVAQRQVVEQLRAMDPPVEVVPSLDTVRAEYLKSDAVGIEPVVDPQVIAEMQQAGLGERRYYAYVDVEVSDSQVRYLRAGERQESALKLGGLLFVVLAGVFGFLRLDGWTKGYLTGGLAVGFAVAVGAAVVLFFSAR